MPATHCCFAVIDLGYPFFQYDVFLKANNRIKQETRYFLGIIF